MALSRRKVFGGAAALAAVGAFSAPALALDSGDRARLADLLASGATIDGQRFSFYDGKPLMIGNTEAFKLRGCTFTWYGKAPKAFRGFNGKSAGRLQDCTFEHAEGTTRQMIIRKI